MGGPEFPARRPAFTRDGSSLTRNPAPTTPTGGADACTSTVSFTLTISVTDISKTDAISPRRMKPDPEAPTRPQPTGEPEWTEPLTPAVYQILVALAEGERHGYAIMKDVMETTGGAVRMGPGTLYGTLKRMLEAGLIAEAGERPDPDPGEERRRYYKLTAQGSRAAMNETQRMARIVRAATRRGLGGRPTSIPSPA